MNWDDLRIFHAIARTGSLTAAARQLDIDQSTVSRRLAAMESVLGVRLINRRAGTSSLTVAGQEVLTRAETVAGEFDHIEQRVAGRDAQLAGRLRVTCTDHFANRYLAPHFVRFARTYPGVELEITTRYQHLSLARREADVAIRTTVQPPDTLMGRRLFRFALAVYGAPDVASRLPPQPDPGDMTWIGWTNEDYNRLMITRHYPAANIRHRVDSLVDLVTMTREGLGVAVLGCFSADPDPRLQRIYDTPITDADMDLWILTHPDLARVRRVRTFMTFIADTFLADRDLFEGRRPY